MKPYREKTPVLCFYEYLARGVGKTVRLTDAVMVLVEFSDQIEIEFDRALRRRAGGWHWKTATGPKPLTWKLLKYLTPDGRERF